MGEETLAALRDACARARGLPRYEVTVRVIAEASLDTGAAGPDFRGPYYTVRVRWGAGSNDAEVVHGTALDAAVRVMLARFGA